MTLLATLLLILAATLGMPLFVVLGAGGLLATAGQQLDSAILIVEMNRLATSPNLVAIPLFTLAGVTLAAGGAPQRLIRVFNAMFGWLPGGLAIVALTSCAFFTAFSGASGVTILALGGLLYPMLTGVGYRERFSLGLLTSSGSLGLLFPPSLPLILYGLVAKVSIDQLFTASAVPGVLLLVMLGLYALWTGKRAGVQRTPFSFERVVRAAKAAAWEIPLPFIIIGGIYAGWFTASEAAAVMAFYVLVVEVFIYRDLAWGDLPGVIGRAMTLVGAILIVLGTALGLTNYLIDAEVPTKIFEWLHLYIGSKTVFLLALNAFLLVVNMVEIFSAIIIVVPIIVPIAAQYGIDPIHLGVLFLLNLEIGYMTPPLGLNLFLSRSRFDAPLGKLYAATLPFWLMMLGALALVTYVPSLSLCLLKR